MAIFKCEDCGNRISKERVLNAQTRRKKPRFCSDVCRDRARNRRARQKDQ